MSEWIASIDESGDFETRESLVGGLLVEWGSRAVDGAAIKAALLSCFPWAEWPLHSTELRQLGSILEGVLRRPAAFAPFAAMVRQSTDPSLKDFCARVDRGPVDYKTRMALAQGLPLSSPVVFRQLEEQRDQAFLKLRRCLSALDQTLGHSVTVVAATCAPGEEWGVAFKRCVRRAIEVVRSQAAPQDVLRLTVAERGDTFDREQLEAWVEEVVVEPVPTGRRPSPDLEVLVDVPRAMDAHVSPWLVLADFATNLMLSPFSVAHAGWASREALVRDRLGLAARRKPRSLSGLLPLVDRVPGPVSLRWEAEQRAEWVRAGGVS